MATEQKDRFESRVDWDEFLRLKDELSLRDLADHFGATVNTVNRVIARNGLTRVHAKPGRPSNAARKQAADLAPDDAGATDDETLPPEPGEAADHGEDFSTMTRKAGGKARVVTRGSASPQPPAKQRAPARKASKNSPSQRAASAPVTDDASGDASGEAPTSARSAHKALGVQRARRLSEQGGEAFELPAVNVAPKVVPARKSAAAAAARPMSDATTAARRKYMALEAFYPEIADKDPEEIARRTGIDVESVRVFLEQKRLAPAAPVAVAPVAKSPAPISKPAAVTPTGTRGWRVEFTDGSHGVVLAPSLAAAAAVLGARASSVTKVELVGAVLNS